MINQLLFIEALILLGTVWSLALLNYRTHPFFSVAIAPYVGAALWIALSVICLIGHIPFTAPILTGGVLALLAAGSLVLRKQQRLHKDTVQTIGLSLLLYGALLIPVLLANVEALTADSFWYIRYGTLLVKESVLNQHLAYNFRDVGVALVVLQSAAAFFHFDYLYGLGPVFFVSLALALLAHIDRTGRRATLPGVQRLLIAGSAVAALVSAYFMVFQGFYVHTNLTTSGYFFLFAVMLLEYLRGEDERPSPFLIMILLFGFISFRIETGMFALIAVSASLPLIKQHLRSQAPLILALAVPIAVSAIWTATLFTIKGGSRTDLLLMMSIACGLFVVGLALLTAKRLNFLMEWANPLMTIGLGLAFAYLVQSKLPHMQQSFNTLIQNLLLNNFWGATWLVSIPLLGLCFVSRPTIRDEGFFRSVILAYFVFVLSMSYARTPYRSGFGDSGNRMMTHILPLCVYYFAVKGVAASRRRDEDAASPSGAEASLRAVT